MKPRVIVIAGPTAVGKTRLGVAVCKALDGEVVSCDSMQIYRDMNIGTAKATIEEMQGVPHHLLSFVDPASSYSVAQYQEDAAKVIQDIVSRGKVPVLVGGTGLFINAVLYPMTFMQYDPTIRAQIEQDYATFGNQVMYDRLVSLAPQMATKLYPNDKKRVSRALELVAMGNQHHTDDLQKESKVDYKMFVLSDDRATLYRRIDSRVDEMLQAGLLDEIKSLLSMCVSSTCQSFQAIAYKEFASYLAGDMGYNETVELVKKRSRNYAKRQLTWFRQYQDAIWLNALDNNVDRVVEEWKKWTK